MANNTSQHILNTSANLLGFCLFVITSLRMGSKVEARTVDIITLIVAMMLTFSCLFSFLSIKTIENERREEALETIAEYLFLFSLAGILVAVFFITWDFM